MAMVDFGALRAVMDGDVDAMPSRTMGLPSNHGITPPAASPIPSNGCGASSRGLETTIVWLLRLIIGTAQPSKCGGDMRVDDDSALIGATDHPNSQCNCSS
jgi:hypothetical protein